MSLNRICSLNSLNMLDNICYHSDINFHQDYFLNHFRDINIINRGGFGIVFRAFREKKEYAIKVVPFLINKRNPETIVSCRINNKLNEVRCLEDLQHPNIISYYFSWIEIGNIIKTHAFRSDNISDFFGGRENSNSLEQSMFCHSIDDEPFQQSNHILININIQMELMDMSLRQYLKINEIKKREIKKIINSVLSGVHYLHRKNIIHCDLKPENILLRLRDNVITSVKIADFGLVMERSIVETEIDTNQYGTPSYMPPEVNRGIIVDKYDIYSLGIIFFELLHYFSTEMERSHKLRDFKNKNKNQQDNETDDNKLHNKHNDSIDHFLKKMVSNNYTERPTIKQVITYFEMIT